MLQHSELHLQTKGIAPIKSCFDGTDQDLGGVRLVTVLHIMFKRNFCES